MHIWNVLHMQNILKLFSDVACDLSFKSWSYLIFNLPWLLIFLFISEVMYWRYDLKIFAETF